MQLQFAKCVGRSIDPKDVDKAKNRNILKIGQKMPKIIYMYVEVEVIVKMFSNKVHRLKGHPKQGQGQGSTFKYHSNTSSS